jgi:pimeloyl-ACP methyl ester carboxylesterase
VLTHKVEGPPAAPAVLLLNGGMMSIAAWDDVAAALAADHRVARCDFRGQLLTPELPRIACPTLMVAAEHDALMPAERTITGACYAPP